MLTHLRLFLAQLILPKGYEVADSDYAQSMATNCYFRGKLSAFLTIKDIMNRLYGTDWRDYLYKTASKNIEFYDNITNPPTDK